MLSLHLCFKGLDIESELCDCSFKLLKFVNDIIHGTDPMLFLISISTKTKLGELFLLLLECDHHLIDLIHFSIHFVVQFFSQPVHHPLQLGQVPSSTTTAAIHQ